MKLTEWILIGLEWIARHFGFGLVPLEDAEILTDMPIPYNP